MGQVASVGCCSSSVAGSMDDAYGQALAEGDWLETTDSDGKAYKSDLAKVKFVFNDVAIVDWGSFGNYRLSREDMRDHRLRKVIADVKGKKFQVGQVVQMKGEQSLGVVASASSDSVVCTWSGSKSLLGSSWDQTYDQDDVHVTGLTVVKRRMC